MQLNDFIKVMNIKKSLKIIMKFIFTYPDLSDVKTNNI